MYFVAVFFPRSRRLLLDPDRREKQSFTSNYHINSSLHDELRPPFVDKARHGINY